MSVNFRQQGGYDRYVPAVEHKPVDAPKSGDANERGIQSHYCSPGLGVKKVASGARANSAFRPSIRDSTDVADPGR